MIEFNFAVVLAQWPMLLRGLLLTVALTAVQRQAILRAARRRLEIPYDWTHGDVSWRNLSATPRALDCSSFVCRVAMEALGYTQDHLAPGAEWLIDNLIEVSSPELGDLVGYGRAATDDEFAVGHDEIWHVMIYVGNGDVIGACDIAGEVVVRPIDYEAAHGPRRWTRGEDPNGPYRALEVRRRAEVL